jgi:hypothetical protein
MSASDILVQPGMDVYDRDAEPLGRVQAIEGSGFRVTQTRGPDLFVPRSAVAEVSEVDRRVDLSIPSAELNAPA